jgi:Ca2+/Na+ antiporter
MLSDNDLQLAQAGRMPLMIGAVLLGAAALTGLAEDQRKGPGVRAFLCWIPIAAAAIAAVVMHHADAAITIVFCTSVAILSLIQGFILLISPRDETPTAYRRLWPFVIPATLAPLLAGFSTDLQWIHALIFLCLGAALFLAWTEIKRTSPKPTNLPIPVGKLNGFLWIVLVALGAIGATRGALRAAGDLPYPASNVVVLAILGPLLVMPLIIRSSSLAQRQEAWAATSTGVGVVLLNLCLLLPIVILLRYRIEASSWATLAQVPPLVFPLITWRVDNVILLLLAFVLLPAALERWRLGRAEGLTLLGLYVVYLLMEVAAVLQV